MTAQFPQYPMQYPQQPQPLPQFPPQQYPPQPPTQQFPQQAAPQAPTPVGNLDDFYAQPATGGGPSLKFNQKPVGTSYSFIVARKLTDSDIQPQTNNQGITQTYKDGRPKLVMVVPVLIQHPEYPEGRATWWVKGQARDELARAMSEVGAPAGPPEEGAAIRVTLTGHRQIPNMNPQLLYSVEYQRPQNAKPTDQSVKSPQSATPAEQAPAPAPQPMPTPPVEQQPAQASAQPVQQPPAPQTPSALNPDQQQLLAQLTGQQ